LERLQWGERLMDYEEDAIEQEIAIAATLCIKGLRAGLPVGFAANMTMDNGNESAILLPSAGAAREEELLTAFARLTLVRTLRFVTFLESLTVYSNLDMVILSCYDSKEIQGAMQALRRAGNQVQLHVLACGKAVPHEA